MTQDLLKRRWDAVLEAIDTACIKSGRQSSSVKLIAVSKFHSVQDMLTLKSLGQEAFGENYAQEAVSKMAVFEDAGFDTRSSFHFIGHLQSRKVPLIAGKVALLHTLDSQKLAQALEKELVKHELIQEVLLEVNLASEPQKSGVLTADLECLATYLLENCPHLRLKGLMCLPPVFDSGEGARPYFASLRKLNEKLSSDIGLPLPELSMGMSGDFAGAIAEGATLVRIGTALFGPRPKKV